MLDGRLQLESKDLEAKGRKKSDAPVKDGGDDKSKVKLDRSGDESSKGNKVEKITSLSGVSSKKSIIDPVNLSQDEPKSEVERMIQHKLLQKKLSGQGLQSNENNGDGQKRTGNEGLATDSDILNQFRGVEMEDGSDFEDRSQPEVQKRPSEVKKGGQKHDLNSKKIFQEEYEAEEDAGDDPMLGIWGGPKADDHSKLFVR